MAVNLQDKVISYDCSKQTYLHVMLCDQQYFGCHDWQPIALDYDVVNNDYDQAMKAFKDPVHVDNSIPAPEANEDVVYFGFDRG